NEIKPPKTVIVRAADVQDQSSVEQAVAAVQRFAWKIELGCEDATTGLLDLDVIVAGSAGIGSRHNGGEPPATSFIRVLITPQPVTRGVICTRVVVMPHLHERLWHRPAPRIKHKSANTHPFAPRGVSGEVALERAVGFEIRPFGLGERVIAPSMAIRRRVQIRTRLRRGKGDSRSQYWACKQSGENAPACTNH